jgi:hypothetical protein
LASHVQDLVIISNSSGYVLVGARGHRLGPKVARRRWAAGLRRALAALPGRSQALVLGDTPHMDSDVPRCLARARYLSRCTTRRSQALDPDHDRAERDATLAEGGMFVSLNEQVCPYDPCPVVVNELLIWRDWGHLTRTYARQLAPSLREPILDALRSG